MAWLTFLMPWTRRIAVQQRLRSLRQALPDILAQRTDVLTPRMTHMIEGLTQDWRHLDERTDAVTGEIEALVAADEACQHLMSVPGVAPIIASAMVASIGNGAAFQCGRENDCLAATVKSECRLRVKGLNRSRGSLLRRPIRPIR